PLKVMVLRHVTQRQDDRQTEDRTPIAIDKTSPDELLGMQDLQATFAVPNYLQADAATEELAVNLKIHSTKGFNPCSPVDRVPEVKKLMGLRRALVALKGPPGNAPAFRKAVESVLSDDDSRERVLAELGLADQQPQT